MSHSKKKTAKIDWSELLWPLILFAFSIILSPLFIFASQEYHNDVSEWAQTQSRHFGRLEKEYTQTQEALEIVNSLYLEKFNQLITDGFFSNEPRLEEQRLKMFKKIQTLLSQLPLFLADYALSETKLYTAPDFIDERVKTYSTQLILKLEVLHEEDILKLIETIEFAGRFNLQRCDIKRLAPKIEVKNISNPYFKATCVLARYTSSIEKAMKKKP
jgi:hypothetical protein